MTDDLVIDNCLLELTCFACPEQYDVYYMDNQIGYLRLRHGRFTSEYPDVGGKLVYLAYTKGDGSFTEDERLKHLSDAVAALLKEHSKSDQSSA